MLENSIKVTKEKMPSNIKSDKIQTDCSLTDLNQRKIKSKRRNSSIEKFSKHKVKSAKDAKILNDQSKNHLLS